MAFSKLIRKQIYDKYDGHCAYCGCPLEMKDMQIDHMVSRFNSKIHGNEIDNTIDNLNPSCRQCNYYKGASNIEGFRNKIKRQLSHTCIDSFQVRLAIKYGIISYTEWDNLFYFEKIKTK